MKKIYLWLLPLIIVLSMSLYISRVEKNNPTFIEIGKNKIEIEIVDTPEKMSMGLSNRQSLPYNSGMLFIMPNPIITAFWMKDMRFPIDIIWIDQNYKIIKIDSSVMPETYPNTFSPPSLIKYVLEVNAGYSEDKNIKAGDAIKIVD